MSEKSDPKHNQSNRRGENAFSDLDLLRGIIAEVDKKRAKNAGDTSPQNKPESIKVPEKPANSFEPYPAPEDLKEYELFLDCFFKGMTEYMPVFTIEPKVTLVRNIVRKTIGRNLGETEKAVDLQDRIVEYNQYLSNAFIAPTPSEFESMFSAETSIDGPE